MLQLLSYVAQTERDFIRQRQAEGIAAAMARGVHFGRTPKERPATFHSLREQWIAGKVSARGLLVNSTSLTLPFFAGVVPDKPQLTKTS